MHVTTHIYTSAALSVGLYATTRSSTIAAVCLASGILIDLDHVYDFLLYSGERFTLRNFFSWCNDGRWSKITVFFHSYELYMVLGAAAYFYSQEALTGMLFGAGLHLMLDEIGNRIVHTRFRLSKWFYFLSYRAAVGFRKEKLRIDLTPAPTGSFPGDAACR